MRIVAAIRLMALSPGWELTHVVDAGDKGAADEHWIRRFMGEGGDAILTADADFFRLPPQVVAVFETGARVIHLPPRWASARGELQAAHILLWWRRIELRIAAMKPRECYRPSWNIDDSGELKQVSIDFHAAHRKHRQATRRTD